jgi:hypothetical protein
VRLWTDADVEKVRKYKQENYRKGRGRKPKPKAVGRKRDAPVQQTPPRP